jgi:hypothetical protein
MHALLKRACISKKKLQRLTFAKLLNGKLTFMIIIQVISKSRQTTIAISNLRRCN